MTSRARWLGALLFFFVVGSGCASGSGTEAAFGTGGEGGDQAGSTRASTHQASSSQAATGTGGGTGGKQVGAVCTSDDQCASDLCKAVLLDTAAKVCVTPCTTQDDCGDLFFCDPLTAGSADGYCVPQSPAHCLACEADADCGGLSEACFQAEGDDAEACHVDCTLSGDAACPSDYACVNESSGTTTRRVCRPTGIPSCNDATGGFCDRVTDPQPCARADAAGSCTGERACLPSGRFDACDAPAPACKASCDDPDPTGCTANLCAGAADAMNCGGCGTVCPGAAASTDNVTCEGGATCSFSCKGENYDVDGDPANGCEVTDAVLDNHVQAEAAYAGAYPCDDGSSNPNISGEMPVDKRAHATPSINGFDAATGSSPDWWVIDATGGTFCQNEVYMQLAMNGVTDPGCYRLDVQTNSHSFSCVPSNGSCTVGNGSDNGQYSGGTKIYFTVSRTCAPTNETAHYTITGNL